MAHGITKNDKMAYVGATPWHNLGTVINENDTFDEAWQKGGLTWSISKRPLTRPDKNGNPVAANRVSIVRDDTDEELSTAGVNWECYQNSELRDSYLRPMVESGLVTLETLGSLHGGQKVWGLARVKNQVHEIVKNDPVELFVLAAMGHDGKTGLLYGGTATRVVCNNTLESALNGGGQVRIRHTKNMRTSVKAVTEAIMTSIGSFDKTCEVFKALAAKKLSNSELTIFLNTLFPKTRSVEDVKAEALSEFNGLLARPFVDKRTADEVFSARAEATVSRAHDRVLEILQGSGMGLDIPGVRGTAWSALNAATQYLTHEQGRSVDTRMDKLVFGGGNGIGARALSTAVDAFLR